MGRHALETVYYEMSNKKIMTVESRAEYATTQLRDQRFLYALVPEGSDKVNLLLASLYSAEFLLLPGILARILWISGHSRNLLVLPV